jgi:hypothetical protein
MRKLLLLFAGIQPDLDGIGTEQIAAATLKGSYSTPFFTGAARDLNALGGQRPRAASLEHAQLSLKSYPHRSIVVM